VGNFRKSQKLLTIYSNQETMPKYGCCPLNPASLFSLKSWCLGEIFSTLKTPFAPPVGGPAGGFFNASHVDNLFLKMLILMGKIHKQSLNVGYFNIFC
jgi:hypothetical protein